MAVILLIAVKIGSRVFVPAEEFVDLHTGLLNS